MTGNTSNTSEGLSSAVADQAELDADTIAAWLRKHPDFFHRHADLLLELSIPHESGKAISLLERQVTMFRERQNSLQDQIHEFIGNARTNDNLFEKTRLVILDVLRSTSFSALLAMMAERLRADFDASAAALVFVSDGSGNEPGVVRLSTSSVRTALGDLFAKQRTYCGMLNPVQQQLLFPTAKESAPIVSAAIVPLHMADDAPVRQLYGLPMLLIGSTREQHFNSSLDTLFLDFIGEVLSVRLHTMQV
ncbi:MAG: hypothetical protein RLZZ227_1424 [Pseudomonadota bacterium]|jgi:uncharacterized protein YigA (DUF484 family)